MKNESMSLDEAKQILKNNGYLVEDFEEDVARRRLNELSMAHLTFKVTKRTSSIPVFPSLR